MFILNKTLPVSCQKIWEKCPTSCQIPPSMTCFWFGLPKIQNVIIIQILCNTSLNQLGQWQIWQQNTSLRFSFLMSMRLKHMVCKMVLECKRQHNTEHKMYSIIFINSCFVSNLVTSGHKVALQWRYNSTSLLSATMMSSTYLVVFWTSLLCCKTKENISNSKDKMKGV